MGRRTFDGRESGVSKKDMRKRFFKQKYAKEKLLLKQMKGGSLDTPPITFFLSKLALVKRKHSFFARKQKGEGSREAPLAADTKEGNAEDHPANQAQEPGRQDTSENRRPRGQAYGPTGRRNKKGGKGEEKRKGAGGS